MPSFMFLPPNALQCQRKHKRGARNVSSKLATIAQRGNVDAMAKLLARRVRAKDSRTVSTHCHLPPRSVKGQTRALLQQRPMSFFRWRVRRMPAQKVTGAWTTMVIKLMQVCSPLNRSCSAISPLLMARCTTTLSITVIRGQAVASLVGHHPPRMTSMHNSKMLCRLPLSLVSYSKIQLATYQVSALFYHVFYQCPDFLETSLRPLTTIAMARANSPALTQIIVTIA